ncbi:hypothetical protein EIN_016680 [Entamoeba invadens IP1]|uniref:hypothetical protein n=1 Tax=Entamoeba invadens IP1 TaxID=370355 RepID=UPI0002C3E84D|nr:hypothetical protein EIN_016680 [Entamoeba invadens IP1]ELP90439.1 hypothetical protein EIN_016680 [Entamoeba invadens IP1]|eukprot:XP_004257210.1 hypothetical protein EIN_016680 [Entamoeba invadens IP1]
MKVVEYLKSHLSTVLLILLIILFLSMGTCTTIISKTAYAAISETKDGKEMPFERPLFFNFLMFFGMFLALIVYFVITIVKKVKKYFANRNKEVFGMNETQTLSPEPKESDPQTFGEIEEEHKLSLKQVLIIFIPALCDFCGTYMMNFGLLYVPSSVYQMMRGSTIIFAMFLAIFWRKQKQRAFHFIGVGLIILALILVGCSMFIPTGHSTEDSESSESATKAKAWYFYLIGIALIICAQFLHALQTIIEEILLHDIKADVWFIVGLRGFYGCICCIIFFVAFYFMKFLPEALRENIVDTLYLFAHSPLIIGLCVCYIFIILLFNFAGTAVIQYSNAMIRNILEPMRMITVWIVSVFIYYAISTNFGESIGFNTILQVVGFVLLVLGFLLYTKVIKIPCWFNYEEKNESVFIELEDNKKGDGERLDENTKLEETKESDLEVPPPLQITKTQNEKVSKNEENVESETLPLQNVKEEKESEEKEDELVQQEAKITDD